MKRKQNERNTKEAALVKILVQIGSSRDLKLNEFRLIHRRSSLHLEVSLKKCKKQKITEYCGLTTVVPYQPGCKYFRSNLYLMKRRKYFSFRDIRR